MCIRVFEVRSGIYRNELCIPNFFECDNPFSPFIFCDKIIPRVTPLQLKLVAREWKWYGAVSFSLRGTLTAYPTDRPTDRGPPAAAAA